MPNGEETFDETLAAQELEKEKGISRLEMMRKMAEEKAKKAIEKAAKEAAKKLAMAIGKAILAGLKAIAVALAPLLPYILIIGAIVLGVFLVVNVLLSGDPSICDELIKDEGFFNAVKEMYEIGGLQDTFPCVVAGIKELGPARAVEEATSREEEVWSTLQGGF